MPPKLRWANAVPRGGRMGRQTSIAGLCETPPMPRGTLNQMMRTTDGLYDTRHTLQATHGAGFGLFAALCSQGLVENARAYGPPTSRTGNRVSQKRARAVMNSVRPMPLTG